MTTGPSDAPASDPPASRSPPRRVSTCGTVLRTAGARIRRDPVLVVPFAVAGLLVALADWLRERDSLPVAEPDWFGRTFSVQYSPFPAGTARTARPVDALVDLHLRHLLAGVALELVVFIAVGLAGWLTITRALDAERRPGQLARYFGFLSAVAVVPRLLGSPSIEVGSLLVGVLVLFVGAFVLVRLFLVPGLLAAGHRFTTALTESRRRSRGAEWSLFWVIVTLGLASWGLARVPLAGGFLSTAVVGSVHAGVLAVVLRGNDDDDDEETAVSTGRRGTG